METEQAQVSEVRERLRAVIQATVSRALELGLTLDGVRGIGGLDPDKDAMVEASEDFKSGLEVVRRLPFAVERFGPPNEIMLQFVYEFFNRAQGLEYSEGTFGEVWDCFIKEVNIPYWTYRGVANLTSFHSSLKRQDFGNDVCVMERNFDELKILGFSDHIIHRIKDDWNRPAASAFVIVAEHRLAKTVNSRILLNSEVWTKALRTLAALRLSGAGDISMGTMWIARPSLFHFGFTGIPSVGVSLPNSGQPYILDESSIESFRSVYHDLQRLEETKFANGPGNLDLALRSFMGTYDRWPTLPDFQILDAITALEAMLGTESEISFKLAYRVASILANTDRERSELLHELRGFYDTRSTLVHGGSIQKDKHRQRLGRVHELRAIVRRLVRAFVHLAASSHVVYTKKFFQNDLDATLVSQQEREALRLALGLVAMPR